MVSNKEKLKMRRKYLFVVVPIVLILMFGIIYFSFNNNLTPEEEFKLKMTNKGLIGEDTLMPRIVGYGSLAIVLFFLVWTTDTSYNNRHTRGRRKK